MISGRRGRLRGGRRGTVNGREGGQGGYMAVTVAGLGGKKKAKNKNCAVWVFVGFLGCWLLPVLFSFLHSFNYYYWV